jgi:SAM-dependent methyltransferase
MKDWLQVWDSRTGPARDLADLIALDGFDKGAGKISVKSWLKFVAEISKELDLAAHADCEILELGCGAGAFLLALIRVNPNVKIRTSGVDFSESLLAIARQMIPDGYFHKEDLRLVSFDSEYDHVISHGVLHYLKVEDARDLVRRTLPATRKSLALLDLPRRATMHELENIRRASLMPGEYDRLYSELSHTYFDTEDFRDLVPEGWQMRESNARIEGYSQSPYRYHLIFSKPSVI